MFDNANTAKPGYGVNQTLGLQFLLDTSTKKSTLLKELYNPNDTIYVQTQGSFETLSNGSIFMEYSQVPKIKDYGPTGDVRLRIQFG